MRSDSVPLSAKSPGVPSGAAMARLATYALAESSLIALVLETPSSRIIAASNSAADMLAPGGGEVVGRNFEEFTSDESTGGVALFAGARTNGLEMLRVLRRLGGPDLPVRMWIRRLDQQSASGFVLAVLAANAHPEPGPTLEFALPGPPAVVGIADAELRIDRISSDGASWFGWSVADLLGRPLAELIAAKDVANFLAAMAEAAARQQGVALFLEIAAKDERARTSGGSHGCEVLILPLQPSPSCAFVLMPMPAAGPLPTSRVCSELSTALTRLGRGVEVANLARTLSGISERPIPGLDQLTTRELEMVNYLRRGDRPPAIARKLFLSQSTVRNHLCAVFAKLGVASQQALVDLFRDNK